MTTRFEGAGARDVRVSIIKAGEEIGADVVPEGQIALAFSYDEVFYIQGTTEDVWFVLDSARQRLRKLEEVAAPVIPEDQPTYTADTVWGDYAGKPTVYTYTFSDGRIFQQEERKNIVTGGFSQKVTLIEGGKSQRSTLKALRAATQAAKEQP